MKKSVVIIISVAVCAVLAATLFFGIKSGFIPINKGNGNSSPSETESTSETQSRTVRVTFPEGFSISQIAQRLEENSVCSAQEFIVAANDPSLYEEYPLLGEIEKRENRTFIAEGYVFPSTLDFYRGESPKKALRRFLSVTERNITQEMKDRAEELGYTLDEILTIASIIQKEAGLKEEMVKVSSVLHNRLKAHYTHLGFDVTIHYLNRYVIPFIDGDTERYNEFYNTYKCNGLPVGPICNPGMDAIEAALYPEDTPYYFFVTDKENNYYYAETYDEHLKNCEKVGIK